MQDSEKQSVCAAASRVPCGLLTESTGRSPPVAGTPPNSSQCCASTNASRLDHPKRCEKRCAAGAYCTFPIASSTGSTGRAIQLLEAWLSSVASQPCGGSLSQGRRFGRSLHDRPARGAALLRHVNRAVTEFRSAGHHCDGECAADR